MAVGTEILASKCKACEVFFRACKNCQVKLRARIELEAKSYNIMTANCEIAARHKRGNTFIARHDVTRVYCTRNKREQSAHRIAICGCSERGTSLKTVIKAPRGCVITAYTTRWIIRSSLYPRKHRESERREKILPFRGCNVVLSTLAIAASFKPSNIRVYSYYINYFVCI